MVGCDKSKLSALWRNPFTDASTGGRSKGKQHLNHNAMESDFKTKLILKEQRKILLFNTCRFCCFGHLNKQTKQIVISNPQAFEAFSSGQVVYLDENNLVAQK